MSPTLAVPILFRCNFGEHLPLVGTKAAHCSVIYRDSSSVDSDVYQSLCMRHFVCIVVQPGAWRARQAEDERWGSNPGQLYN